VAPKANSQLMDIKGKAYLKVPGRVEMFREDHPLGVITTELVHLEPRVIVRAVIHGADGTMIASGYGTAPMIGKGESTWRDKEIEKAETAAVGRALGFAGYGTLAAFADDDRDNLADAPIEPPRQAEPPAANGWTREQANSLGLEAKRLNVTTDELLALLNVAKLSEYAPGFSAARDNLQKYAKARPPMDAAPATEVVF
jgi:hypothetical protein